MSETPVGQIGEGLRLVLVAGLLLLSVGLVFRSRHISSARHLEQAGVQQVGTQDLLASLASLSSVENQIGPVLCH